MKGGVDYMDRRIIIEAGDIKGEAMLADSETANAIWDSLPIESVCNTWGDEVYFDISTSLALDETAAEVVDMGDVGYWPPGTALCIFFGPTPASRGDEIRPASAVNIVGRIVGDPKKFKKVSPGARIEVRRTE
jgi:hypothetical protein